MLQKKSLFYSQWFWMSWFIISSLGIAFTYKYFHKAVPLLNLTISMDRDDALKDARQFASQFNLSPSDYHQAASFDADRTTKNFIELEGGGSEKLISIMEQGLYSIYTWKVRHFEENNPHETLISFKPDGTLYGFHEKLSEDLPGAALSKSEAQKLAEKGLQKSWLIDVSLYKLVEDAQETQPSGRIDHTFTYERIDQTIGEAPYRLTVIVSGDTITKVKHSVKVPEAFTRRYENMRSANNTIARFASFLFMLLYLVAGAIFGLLFLMPRGWIVYEQAVYWAALICGLLFLNDFNSWPSYWMYYNTAYSTVGFTLQLIVSFITEFITEFGIVALSFIAAENLTRAAFGDKIQLWKAWSKNAAHSFQVARQTLAGYLILGIHFAYVTLFYFITLKYFGWWSPMDSLYDPNVLANYMPWFSPLVQSLKAGFWEECIFRAVPLACAALLGKKFGKEKWWIGIAFVLQAFIFGAAHANYAAQPAYARVLELIIPSFIFGALYLFCGLLPAIIAHVVYDIVWFSLPLFISNAPGIWLQKLLVIMFSALPLIIIITARWWYGSWSQIKPEFLNKNFKPDSTNLARKHYEPVTHKSIPLFKFFQTYSLATLGGLLILSLVAFNGYKYFTFFNTKQNIDTKITIDRTAAINQAYDQFKDKNVSEWTALTNVKELIDQKHRFIWQTLGKETYEKLLTSYLNPAYFKVRLVQFEGDVAQRQEEYNLVTNGSRIIRTHHQLAENQAQESLSESAARKQAIAYAEKTFNVAHAHLKEISAVPSKKPNRTDWKFTFQDTTQELQEGGQARIIIELSGNEISDSYRDIFIPEKWKRTDEFNQMLYGIVKSLCGLALMLTITLGLFLLFRSGALHLFNTKIALIFFTLLTSKTFFQLYNMWYTFTGEFKTSEPYSNQIFSQFMALILYSLILAGLLACAAGIIHALRPKNMCPQPMHQKVILLLSGVIVIFFYIIGFKNITLISPQMSPIWPTFLYINAQIPSLAMALTTWTSYVSTTLLFLFIAALFDLTITNRYVSFLYALITSLAFIGYQYQITSIASWFEISLILAIFASYLYHAIFKYDRSLIPLATGMIYSGLAIQQALYNAWNGVWIGALLTMILIMSFSFWWSDRLQTDMKKVAQ
jgi:hypothetical protein